MTHPIHIGIGGWTYEPWRGVFYPDKLSQKKELEFASRALTSIEINGTYYSTFKPDSWMKWRDETPDDFVFAVKASRYCTNRKVLSDMGESMERFLGQGLSALGDKLGPINWQFMGTKKFDPADFEGFLKLLPKEQDGCGCGMRLRCGTRRSIRRSFTIWRRNTGWPSSMPWTTRPPNGRALTSRPPTLPMPG